VFTVEPGKGFLVERVQVAIENGAGSAVSVRVFSGDSPIAPEDTAIDIAGEIVPLAAETRLSPGDEVTARHDNTSSTDRDVTVVVEGEDGA